MWTVCSALKVEQFDKVIKLIIFHIKLMSQKIEKIRRHHSSEFKRKVVIEAIKEQKTLSQLKEEYELYANQISECNRVLSEQSPILFGRKSDSDTVDIEALTNPLYQQIGQLKVEVEFLKKKLQQLGQRNK